MSKLRMMFIGALGVVAITAASCGDGAPASSSSSGGGGGAPVGSVAGSGTPNATVNQVTGQKFDPKSATVKVGQVVAWKNTDSIAHNVTFDGHDDITNPNMSAGDTFMVKFTTAGSYSYKCTFHDGMTGTITVS